jgi:DNA polymerase-3 subunit beta
MDLTIRREDLLSGLALAHTVADRKSTMPILASVLLAADAAGRLRFGATDLCVSVSARAEATVKRPGAVASHAHTLFEIVKNLPDGEVTLSVGKNHALRVQSGTIDFRVPGAPSDEFPTLPSHRKTSFAEIEAGALEQLLARTHYAMSSDETRPHLAGVLFESDGKLARMVATDGHRLSKAEVEVAQLEPFAMLLPRTAVKELRRLVGSLAEGRKLGIAVVDGGTAFFHAVDVVLSVKLSSEQFPPYAKVIPRSSSRRVLVARELLARLAHMHRAAGEGQGGRPLLHARPQRARDRRRERDPGHGT